MTQKSAARKQRDTTEKALKNDQTAGWDDLKGMYETSAEAMVIANEQLLKLFKIPGILNFIPNAKDTGVMLRGLDKDLKFFSEELSDIYKTHSHRSGKADDGSAMAAVFTTFERYMNWKSRYDATVMPTVIILAEQGGLAVQALTDALNKADVNTVTDVIVKNKPDGDKPADATVDNK